MAARVAKPWAVKPPVGSVVNLAHPLARGLATVALFNEGAGQKIGNAAPKYSGITGAGAALSWSAGKVGKALKLNGSTARVRWAWPSASFLSGKVALAFRFKLNSSPGTNTWQIFGDDSNGAAGGLYVYFNGITTGRKLEFFVNGLTGAGGYTSRDFGSYVGQWFDVYCEWDGATGWRIEVDGVNDYVSFSTSGGRPNTGLSSRSLGCYYFSGAESRFADVSFEYFYHWEGRTLSTDERRLVRAQPYSFIAAPRRPTFIGVNQATGTIIAADGCSVGTSLDSSYLASYFAAQAISNAMASASAVQSSTAGVNAQGVSQASWNGLSASINGVDGASVAASASSVQTATILVLDANGSAVSCAISSVITQDVMVLSADGVTNGQALFQVDFSATAGVDGAAVGQAIGIGEQSAIVNVSGAASTTSVANAGAAIVLSSDGTSESSSIVAGPGLGIFGADGAAGSAVGYATSSVDVQSIGAVSGSAIGHVVGDTFSGATATVSGTSMAHSVVTGQLAGVIGKDGRDIAVAVARAPKAIVLAKDARSESNSVAKAGRAGIGAATGRSESQAMARGDATTTVTANYPIAIDMTTVPPDSWMVLVPLETTTASVSVYGDDAVPVPVDTWKATA